MPLFVCGAVPGHRVGGWTNVNVAVVLFARAFSAFSHEAVNSPFFFLCRKDRISICSRSIPPGAGCSASVRRSPATRQKRRRRRTLRSAKPGKSSNSWTIRNMRRVGCFLLRSIVFTTEADIRSNRCHRRTCFPHAPVRRMPRCSRNRCGCCCRSCRNCLRTSSRPSITAGFWAGRRRSCPKRCTSAATSYPHACAGVWKRSAKNGRPRSEPFKSTAFWYIIKE